MAKRSASEISNSNNSGSGLSTSGSLSLSGGLSQSGSFLGQQVKKSKYTSYYGIAEDFCGFVGSEVLVHENSIKMMNTELFCKGKQLSEQIG
jgi:hypothetical protein